MNKDAEGRRKVERSESNWKCGANAFGCGRLHCYFTGPLFLLGAVATLLRGFEIVFLPWSWIGYGLLGGTLFAYIPEWVRGKYARSS